MSELTVPQIFYTKLTKLFGISHPIIVSPMAGICMGKLAGAVAAAGGLGLIGIGSHGLFDENTVRKEWEIANEYLNKETGTKGALGFGFLVPFMEGGINDKSFQAVLALNPPPAAVWLSFEDNYEPLIAAIHERGIKVIIMVSTVTGAIASKNQGADVVVVQGSDAGGHGKFLASIVSLVPETVDHLGPDFPVVAAGGVVDGRGLACALILGASGVVLGTRMLITNEANFSDAAKQKYIPCQDGPANTVVTPLFDKLDRFNWPESVYGRVIKESATISKFNKYLYDLEFQPTEEEKTWYLKNKQDLDFKALWCGASVGLIKSVEPAGQVIKEMVVHAKNVFWYHNQV